MPTLHAASYPTPPLWHADVIILGRDGLYGAGEYPASRGMTTSPLGRGLLQ